MIVLVSSDGERFEVEETVALQSETIKHMIQVGCAAGYPISLPNVTARVLVNVIDFCKRHAGQDKDDDLKNYDQEFVNVDMSFLFDLILAGYDMKIKSLLDVACEAVEDLTKGVKNNSLTF